MEAAENLYEYDKLLESEHKKHRLPRGENEDYWDKEESIYRLSPENKNFEGIDIVSLIPENLRKTLLGKFKEQEFPFDHYQGAEYLYYEDGTIEIEEGNGSLHLWALSENKGGIKLNIGNDQGSKTVNFEIETIGGESFAPMSFEVAGKSYQMPSIWASTAGHKTDFGERFIKHITKKDVDEKEKGFAEYAKEVLDSMRDKKIPFNPYPNQISKGLPGAAVDILENIIEQAKAHGYESAVMTPSKFHTAENLERQGFDFQTPEDRARMDMLKIALRAIDKKRFRAEYEKAVAEGLADDKAREKAADSRLTPQERSWIVLLNSVQDQNLIPEEFNLKNLLKEELIALSDDLRKKALEADNERLNLNKTFKDYDEYENLRLKAENRLTPAELIQLQGYGTEWWLEKIANKNENKLLREKGKVEFLLGKLFKMKKLDFSPEKMSLIFEKIKSSEYVQEEMDRLIENEIVTGATINPPESYIERAVENNLEAPYTVVYHMYDKNGDVKQPDGSMVERKNTEHFEEVKKYIESLGIKTHIEKAYGNVRNPGPNHPMGWSSEEPSVWTDELKGIERSSQNALIIDCKNIEEIKQISNFLNSIGYKNKENATRSDPAWYVPDIRIFGVKKEDEEKIGHFRRALLHVKEGKLDGYASTLTHNTHRMVNGYKHVPVMVHEKMDEFIKKGEEERGEYEFVSG